MLLLILHLVFAYWLGTLRFMRNRISHIDRGSSLPGSTGYHNGTFWLFFGPCSGEQGTGGSSRAAGLYVVTWGMGRGCGHLYGRRYKKLKSWCRLSRQNQKLFSEQVPKDRHSEVKVDEERRRRIFPSHRIRQEPRNYFFNLQLRQLYRLGHGAIAQWKIVIQKVPVNIAAKTYVRPHRYQDAAGTQNAVNFAEGMF